MITLKLITKLKWLTWIFIFLKNHGNVSHIKLEVISQDGRDRIPTEDPRENFQRKNHGLILEISKWVVCVFSFFCLDLPVSNFMIGNTVVRPRINNLKRSRTNFLEGLGVKQIMFRHLLFLALFFGAWGILFKMILSPSNAIFPSNQYEMC